jgi:hypothetical protein
MLLLTARRARGIAGKLSPITRLLDFSAGRGAAVAMPYTAKDPRQWPKRGAG